VQTSPAWFIFASEYLSSNSCLIRADTQLFRDAINMSTILANAGSLKPDIRLAQAVSQFEAALSSEQKAALRTYRSQLRDSPPDQYDVMRLTAEIDRRVSGKIGGRCFGPRLTFFLQAVQQFAALGDIVIGGSQNLIACGLWSIVRMSLLVSVARCLSCIIY